MEQGRALSGRAKIKFAKTCPGKNGAQMDTVLLFSPLDRISQSYRVFPKRQIVLQKWFYENQIFDKERRADLRTRQTE